MGDMFSLLWEPEMLQSMGQTIGILASEALSTSIQQILGATILAALMSAIQIPMALSKYPACWITLGISLDRAGKAGKILAETIISGNLGVRPITLVGFSLGSRLIYSCLIEMARRGGYGLIENVIILGPQSLLTLIKCQRQDRWLVEIRQRVFKERLDIGVSFQSHRWWYPCSRWFISAR